jgi:hypothetical protein
MTAIDAIEDSRLSVPNGRVGHAELKSEINTLIQSNEDPVYEIGGTVPGHPAGLVIHFRVDAMTACAVSAGAGGHGTGGLVSRREIFESYRRPRDQLQRRRSDHLASHFSVVQRPVRRRRCLAKVR